MIACCDLRAIWEILNSQFVSTCLGLALGSWLIQRVHIKNEQKETFIRGLISKVETYEEDGYSYWVNANSKSRRTYAIAAKLKHNGFSMYRLISAFDGFDVNAKKDILEQVANLWEVTTGSAFETSARKTEQTIKDTIMSIASKSAIVKSTLGKCL